MLLLLLTIAPLHPSFSARSFFFSCKEKERSSPSAPTASPGDCPVFCSFSAQRRNQVIYNRFHVLVVSGPRSLIELGGRLTFLPPSLQKLRAKRHEHSLHRLMRRPVRFPFRFLSSRSSLSMNTPRGTADFGISCLSRCCVNSPPVSSSTLGLWVLLLHCSLRPFPAFSLRAIRYQIN